MRRRRSPAIGAVAGFALATPLPSSRDVGGRAARPRRWCPRCSAAPQESGGGKVPVPRFRLNPLDAKIARIMIPAVASLSLDPLVALADTAFIGPLGAGALGGVGISTNVFNLTFTCFNFLQMATTPLIAVANGRGDKVEASKIATQSLWIALIVGFTATTLLGVFTHPVVRFFGANDVTAPFATVHLRARILAAPAFLSTMVLQGAFRGHQDTKTPFFVGLVANAVNLVGFYTFIRVLKLGAVGAGLAVAMQQLTFCAGLLYILLKREIIRLEDMRAPPSAKRAMSMLSTGVALTIRTFSIFSTVSFGMAVAGQHSASESAAFEIVRQLFALCAKLFDGISVAAQSLIPVELGRENYEGARRTAGRLLRLAIGMGMLFSAVLLCSRGSLPGIFTADPEVRKWVTRSLPIIALVQPINGTVFVLDGVYTAARQFNFLAATVAGSAACSWLALILVRRNAMTLPWVWVALNVMMLMRAIVLGARYKTKASPVPHRNEADA